MIRKTMALAIIAPAAPSLAAIIAAIPLPSPSGDIQRNGVNANLVPRFASAPEGRPIVIA